MLDPGDGEAGRGGVLLDLRGQRQPAAGVDLVKDELDEAHGRHGQRQLALALTSSSLGMMIVCSSITPSSGIKLKVFLK